MPTVANRYTHIVLCALVCTAVAFVPQPRSAAAQDPLQAFEQQLIEAAAKVEPAVVSIARVVRGNPRPFHDLGQDSADNPASPDFVPNDFGTGVMIRTNNPSHKRLVLTNYHVVRGGPQARPSGKVVKTELWVWMQHRRPFRSSIVAADPHSDLAVLSVDFANLRTNADDLPGLTVEADKRFVKGRFVMAFGNPYAIARDGSASVLPGIISNISRQSAPVDRTLRLGVQRQNTMHNFGTLLQVSARLELGASGGPLVDRTGKLIGLTTSLAALDGYEQAAGYAIPFTPDMKRVVDDLSMGYEVEYGFLGVSPQNAEARDLIGLPGDDRRTQACVILKVIQGSPADVAGIESNDVVLAVNGIPVRNQYDLMRKVGMLGPWDSKKANVAKLTIWRRKLGLQLEKSVQPGKWPVQDDAGVIATAERYEPWRGISVDYSTARNRYLPSPMRLGVPLGVLATRVDTEFNYELQQGDFVVRVAGQAVSTPRDFHEKVRSHGEQPVTLELRDGRKVTISP